MKETFTQAEVEKIIEVAYIAGRFSKLFPDDTLQENVDCALHSVNEAGITNTTKEIFQHISSRGEI